MVANEMWNAYLISVAIVAVMSHWRLMHFIVGVVVAATYSWVVLLLWAALVTSMDLLSGISYVGIGGVVGVTIASVVGVPFVLVRKVRAMRARRIAI